jgi:hypothetical protein
MHCFVCISFLVGSLATAVAASSAAGVATPMPKPTGGVSAVGRASGAGAGRSEVSAIVINGVAAEVAGKPITLEEVYLHRGLSRVKNNELGLLDLEKGEALKNSVQKRVLEQMVTGEMTSLNFDGGPRREAAGLLADRKKKAGFRTEWDKFLNYFRLTEDKAVVLLWRSMQVDRFIEKKVETLSPLLTPDVVDNHLATSNPEWMSLPEPKREELRTRTERLLRKERMSEQLKEWVMRLKRKYSVVQYI